jgi:hypothetical protein
MTEISEHHSISLSSCSSFPDFLAELQQKSGNLIPSGEELQFSAKILRAYVIEM